MGKSAKVSKGGKVTIPKETREKFGLDEGDIVYFEVKDKKLSVYKMEVSR